MKVRYSVNDRGELVDRHGNVFGRVTSLTLEVAEGRGAMGGGVLFQDSSQLSSSVSDRTEGGAGETETDPDVTAVWSHWLERRQPRRRALEPSQAKLIAKGLKVADVDELKRAIDALLADSWHRERGLLNLSTLLATKPGGPTLRDQIDRWLDRATPGTSASPARVEGVFDSEIRALKATVERNARRSPYPAEWQPEDIEAFEQGRREQRDQAAEELQRRFRVATSYDPDGRPTFTDIPEDR